MFNIILYKTGDSANVINKRKTNPITLTGEWKENSDILNPVFTVTRNDALFLYNYAYIEKFNRYYFITDINSVNPYLVLRMKIDVLETYKTPILTREQIISRAESPLLYNLRLYDSKIPFKEGLIVKTIPFGNSFNTEADDFIDDAKHFIVLNSSTIYGQSNMSNLSKKAIEKGGI